MTINQAAEKLLQELVVFNKSTLDTEGLDPILRAQLTAAIRETNSVVSSPADKVAQLMLENPSEASVVQTAADIGIFSAIHSADGLSIDGLANATGADSILLTRLTRALCASHALRDEGDGTLKVAPAYSLFRTRSFEKCFGPCSDFMHGIFRPIPKFLSQNAYKNVTDSMDTVIQYGFEAPQQHFYQIFGSKPDLHTHFSTLMSLWSDGWTQFQTLYPVQQMMIDSFDSSAGAVFVDVGGNWGQQVLALKEAFSQLKGRLVVQDLYAVAAAPKDDPRYAGIEWQAHDFFSPQLEHHARIYYLRTILHNWDDTSVVKILTRLREAMKKDYSKIIIHECIMPERGAGTWITTQDIEMMAMFGSAERTVEEYRQLLAKAGLRLVKHYQDNNPSHEGLIEAEI